MLDKRTGGNFYELVHEEEPTKRVVEGVGYQPGSRSRLLVLLHKSEISAVRL